ncbi:MAG: DNA polymerase III subunit gamma/tau [Dehalococcoidia bacterium]
MSEVLYRKWRPKSLSDLVGQSHISKTLALAVQSNKVSHAYLFCGPRGTGKTSTARILAKAVNCLSPIDGEPDNTCPTCVSISEGRSMDLIEIDAASNRRIGDIRDLSEKIHYLPSESKYKVYIIDEVHMLTQEAFNALLKTLEEPPGHAILLLATTDPQKVPLTIISRCQRFDFKKVSVSDICSKLSYICSEENVDISGNALSLIARKSTGSLRDAENLLDQVIVSFDSPITEENVRDLFHIGDESVPTDLLGSILSKNVNDSLKKLSVILNSGKDPRQVRVDILESVRTLILFKSGVVNDGAYPEQTVIDMKDLVSQIEMPEIVHIAKIFGSIDFQYSVTEALPLEIAVVEAASPKINVNGLQPKSEVQNVADPSRSYRRNPPIVSRERNSSAKKDVQPTILSENPEKRLVPSQEVSENTSENYKSASNSERSESENELDSKWNEIVRGLRQTGNRFNVAALLRGCVERKIEGEKLIFLFQHSSHIDRIRSELDDPSVMAQVTDSVEKTLGKKFEIDILLKDHGTGSQGKPASQRSHLVRAAQSLGARIVEERER